MADFSFLNVSPDGDEDQAAVKRLTDNDPDYLKKFPPMRKASGMTFSGLSDDVGESEEAGQGPTVGGGATGDFQKKRAQAADFAKKQTLNSLDQLANAHAQSAATMGRVGGGMGGSAAGGVQPLDYENIKQRILASSPDNYAQILYQEAQKHQGLIGDDAIGGIMRPSEDAVTAYKQLQMENAVPRQEIQAEMAPADIQNAKLQMASLDQTIEQTKQKMSLAATSRQKNELKQALDFYSSQKRVLQAKIPQQGEQDQEGGIVDRESTMDHAFTAAGLPRHEAIQSLTEMRRIVAMEGIDVSAAVSPLSFIPTYTNLITHIFNPKVANRMLEDMNPPPKSDEVEPPASRMPSQRGGQKSTFGSDSLEQDPRFQRNQQMIQQQEDRHAQVVRELANSGTFKNVGDVLGFVLTSFILGPRVAGLFFSNMEKNGRLRDELNRLDHETTQLYHQQNSYIQLAQHARAMAAAEDHQKQTEVEQVRHDWAVEHYTRGARAATSLSPEDKQIHQALQASLKDHWTEVQIQEKKVKRMDAIQGRGDPRDPDWKFVQANLSKERAKLQQMEQTYQKWRMERVAPWYQKRGIEMVDPSQGTALTEKTFAGTANE